MDRSAESEMDALLRRWYLTLPAEQRPFNLEDIGLLANELNKSIKRLEAEVFGNLLSLDQSKELTYLSHCKMIFENRLHDLQESLKNNKQLLDITISKEVPGQAVLLKYPMPEAIARASFECRIRACKDIIAFLDKQLRGQSLSDKQDEQLPEYEFKSSVQKVAWLYDLGILQQVLELCKEGNSHNFTKAGNIIESFTGILAKNIIIPALRAIFLQEDPTNRNHPLKNPENVLFLQQMRLKFKLDKKGEKE
jgi:hypothetical protein